MFCTPNWNCWAAEETEQVIDWSGSSESIVAGTLKMEYLLVKLQELEDSDSKQTAEKAIREINGAVSEDEEMILKWMQKAGTPTILDDVMQREPECRPSVDVAAPLWNKFAMYPIKSRRRRPKLSTEKKSYWSGILTRQLQLRP